MNRLKELREEKYWTQKYLGSILNVKNAAISKYETGRAALTEDTIIQLAKLFNVSTDYLLGLSNINERATEGIDYANNYNNSANSLILLNEPIDFNKHLENIISRDEYNVLNYYNRLNDENKDYVKGKMIDLYKEQDTKPNSIISPPATG